MSKEPWKRRDMPAFARYVHLLHALRRPDVRRDLSHSRIPDGQFEEAICLRREGMSMREIGERFGCSRQAVQHWFKLRGVKP